MNSTPPIAIGLLFGLVCFIFTAIAVYLLFQVMSRDLDMTYAALVFAPLLLCWVGIGVTMGGPRFQIAEGLGGLAVAWCALIPVLTAAVRRKVHRELMDENIKSCRELLEKNPKNPDTHFRLAESYEDRGLLREAYQEYNIVTTLDPRNIRAKNRARELYEQITHKRLGKNPSQAVAPPPSVLTTEPEFNAPGSSPSTPTQLPFSGPASPPASLQQPPPAPFSFGISPGSLSLEPSFAQGGTSPTEGSSTQALTEPGRLTELRAAVGRQPADASLQASLAEELVKYGRTSEAAQAYRQALALDPSNDRYRFNLYSLLEAAPETTTKLEG